MGSMLFVGIALLLYYLFRQKQKTYERMIKSQKTRLHATRSELQQKELTLQAQVERLEQEKASVEAKYLKKVKAAEVKKKNLAQYRHKNKGIRKCKKSIDEQIKEIVGKGPSWLPHSRQEPASPIMGKPKGSPGGGRERPKKIHEIKELSPQRCFECGRSLEDVEGHFAYDRVVTDLYHYKEDKDDYHSLRLKNVLLNINRKQCPECGNWIYPETGLLKNARLGLSFVSHVISQRIRTGMTYEKIIGELTIAFGPKFLLTVPSIIHWFKRFSEVIEGLYDQLEELVRESAFVHVDETGLPMKGENWWLWVVCCANFVLYIQSSSRGHESIKEIMEGFEGTMISDFFSAYNKFSDIEQQKCLGHLICDVIELIVKLEKEDERIKNRVREHEEAVKREKEPEKIPKKGGRPKKVKKLEEGEVETLKERYIQNSKTLHQAVRLRAFMSAPFRETVLGWTMDKSERMTKEEAEENLRALIRTLREEGVVNEDLRRLLDRCEKFEKSLFTYLKYEGMPPDNNEAERRIRPFVVQRKRSGGFKSPEVMRHYVVYLSLYMTCKLNGKSFNKLLELVFSGEEFDLGSFLAC